ncbi:DNA ligase [Shewanella donghaensis]|uniref:DNA ligase n=1 Tax=Shewanella donghaensis TaxID=238836 RepID=UPI0011837D25|nr:DNA ligase [Shewanella donghaensis]
MFTQFSLPSNLFLLRSFSRYLSSLLILMTLNLTIFTIVFISPSLSAADKPNIQLATKMVEGLDIKDYYISEKLDGVRGYWTGKKMISRSGREIIMPKWFYADFPDKVLEGELWLGRGTFESMSSIARKKKADSPLWQQVRFMLFDMPEHGDVFSERYTEMQREIAKSVYLDVIKQQSIDNDAALYKLLDSVVAANGEGLMLHRKQAFYKVGRSQDIMKLKPKYDAEAIVIAHLEGKGKYRGMLGAILVKMPDGIEFKIGTGFTDAQRQAPPKIGSQITYQYLGLTKNGVPRFAHFLRERPQL